MPYTITGGAVVESANLTRSWGISPASGQVTAMGSTTGLAGADFTLNLGGDTFHGIVADDPVAVNFSEGQKTRLALTDNRVKLAWDDVYCTFNNAEIREDNPATPGIDRQKRYWHITPDNWDAQIKTWTDAPYSARAILDFVFDTSTTGGSYSWSRTYHSAQSGPVNAIDANHGAKLATVVQQITDEQGLVLTLVGESGLVWARKGEGSLPTVSGSDRREYTSGEAINTNDTNVRIVGDRNRYQDKPITLEASWNTSFEEYLFEGAWLAEVASAFSLPTTTISDNAALKAFALTVTVREYNTAKGGGYEDYGIWGEVSRMEIPVWAYLNDIVLKAYRVPLDYTINGIDLDSVELVEGLTAAVEYDIDAGTIDYKSPREYFPDTKAFIIIQGQQLDLIDPRTQTLITEDQLSNARTKWSACNKFNLDTKNKTVIFHHPVFVPGAGDSGLIIFPNQGVSGIDSTDPLYHLAVPNAAVTLGHAAVRASMVFEAEHYSKRYGSGHRKGPKYIKGLNYQALMDGGAFSEEVEYADGHGADYKANALAAALTAQNPTYASGSYTRMGGVGTALSGVIDRVSLSMSFAEGFVESVTLTKEAGQSNFESERELERRQQAKDLYPNQRALKEAADQLRVIAKISKEIKRRAPAGYANLNDVMQRPVGAVDCSPVTFKSSDTWPAGTPVFVTEGTLVPSGTGKVFRGIVIADNATGVIAAATQGIVPVRAKSHFTIDIESTYAASTLARTLAGCSASGSTPALSIPVDLALAIKPGDTLYSVPGSGHDYVTPFDFASVFSATAAAALAAIETAIANSFAISLPGLTALTTTAGSGSASVSAPVVSFPTLSLSLPDVSFGDVDPCKPISSGGQAAVDAFTSYDFSAAFASLDSAVASMSTAFTASITAPSIAFTNIAAVKSSIASAIASLVCSVAAAVDTVLSNIDKLLKTVKQILLDLLTRIPVGTAQEALPATQTEVVLLPVALRAGAGNLGFPKELSDTLFTVLKDIPLFALPPMQLASELLGGAIGNVLDGLGAAGSAVNGLGSPLATLASGLAAGISGALQTVKAAAGQMIAVIQAEHAQLQALLVDFATENKAVLDYAEQYLLQNAVSISNLVIAYLKAPYIASPKIYLLASPWSGLTEVTADDFCELADEFTRVAAELATPTIPDISAASYVGPDAIELKNPGLPDIRIRIADIPAGLTDSNIQLRETDWCDTSVDPPVTKKVLMLRSDPYTP